MVKIADFRKIPKYRVVLTEPVGFVNNFAHIQAVIKPLLQQNHFLETVIEIKSMNKKPVFTCLGSILMMSLVRFDG